MSQLDAKTMFTLVLLRLFDQVAVNDPLHVRVEILSDALQQEMVAEYPDHPCQEGVGGCCRDWHVPLQITQWDIERVERGLRLLSNRTRKSVRQKAQKFHAGKGCECPFLHQGCCSIYANRPLICRLHGTGFVDTSIVGDCSSQSEFGLCSSCSKAWKGKTIALSERWVTFFTYALMWLAANSQEHSIISVILDE